MNSSATLLLCQHCGTLVPRLAVGDQQFQAIVKALSDGSKTLAAAELKHFAQCSEAAAQAWVDHLLNCPNAWPWTEADQKVLQRIDQAFADVSKPEHFADPTHCAECEEHDTVLGSRTRETLRRQDLGDAGWDPVTFSNAQGIAYLFPALARIALLFDVWRDQSWYGCQLLSHLSYDGSNNRFLAWCSPMQREVVYALVRHLADTRRSDIERYGDEDRLQAALSAWQPGS